MDDILSPLPPSLRPPSALVDMPASLARRAHNPVQPEVATYPVFPHWLYNFASSKDFYQITVPLIVVPGTGVETDLGILIPTIPNFQMVIKSLAIFVQNPTTSWNGSFTVRVNGGAVPGWGGLSVFPQNSNGVGADYNGQVRVAEGGIVTVTCINNAGIANPFTVGAAITGWSTPQVDIERYSLGLVY